MKSLDIQTPPFLGHALAAPLKADLGMSHWAVLGCKVTPAHLTFLQDTNQH